MICYHHDDMDGKAAGYCVHKYKPSIIEDSPSSYKQVGYSDNLNMHTNNDDVIIVDISISESTYPMLLEICRTARSVTWIDHHKTSLDVINAHKKELQSIENLTYFISLECCGALLAYTYMHLDYRLVQEIRNTEVDEEYSIDTKYDGVKKIMEVTMNKINTRSKSLVSTHTSKVYIPQWLYHVDDYDCWKKQHKDTDSFYLGILSQNNDLVITNDRNQLLFNDLWESLESNPKQLDIIINNGKVVYSYMMASYKEDYSSTFEWDYEGTKFLCKNGLGNSWNFLDGIEKYDAVILFNYDGKTGMWKYSVYSDEKSKFNCCEFCTKFNGGGHVHASGFSTKHLIFVSKKDLPKTNNKTIFLGGTCNESNWRNEFIKLWDKSSNKEISSQYKIFNPIVSNWSKLDEENENKIKKDSKLNIFVITKEMKGSYSLVEAVVSSYEKSTLLAIYDPDNYFDDDMIKSFDAIGNIIEKNDSIYRKYIGVENISDIVNDTISML